VALFVRTNRGLVLTDAGRMLVPRAERAVAAARDAEEAVRQAGAIASGTVAFGTFSTAHHHLLGEAVAEFRRRYPGGVGDSVASRSLIDDLGLTDRLSWVSLDPPLIERFAFVTPRGAPASAAMAALIGIIERHLALDAL
jgi:hypothetical protein